jgi:hypothetical protein
MKLSAASLTVIALALLAGGCTIGDQERKYRIFFRQTAQTLVPGYRLPDESAYGPLWAAVESRNWQTRDGSGQTKAEFWTSGEFNGDATIDYAYILVEESSDTRNLFSFLSTADGYEAVRLTSGFPWGIWLRTLPPGRYSMTTAGVDSRDSSPSDREFDAPNQVIEFFQFEGAASSFVWNAATQSFDRFWTRD